MKFRVVDPFEGFPRLVRRGAVALVVREGEPEILLVPSPPERVVLEEPEDASGSGEPARPRAVRFGAPELREGSEGLPGLLRRLADALDPDRPSETGVAADAGASLECPPSRLPRGAGPEESARPDGERVPVVLDRADLELLSHRLRTPINALVGYAALLDEAVLGELTPEQADAAKHMRRSAERLLTALRHLLEMTRVDLGDFEALRDVRSRVSGESAASPSPPPR